MREETLIDLYAASNGSTYDEACKRLFQNKEIIAPILQMVVPEYHSCTVEEVMRCIDADSMEDVPIEDVPVKVDGLPTELSSVTDKLIRFDMHFKSLNPVLTTERIRVHLHIDLEVQNNYKPTNPPYPIIKRALYYAVRELSAQLGSLTETTNYAALEKVYSIWICNENIPPELTDTATGYSIRKNDIIGTTDEPEEDFDLLNVIMIRRGGKSQEKIFDYLTGTFDLDVPKMEKYTSISDNKKIVQEVEKMTGMGMGILKKGIEQEKREVIGRMIDGKESMEKIILYAGCTEQDVLQVKEEREKAKREEMMKVNHHRHSR